MDISSDLSTDDLSAFLNGAWDNASATANTLPEQLRREQQTARGLLATGSVSSVGKNSANQSYGVYGPGNLTQRQIMNLWSTLIRCYQVVKDKLIAAAAAAVPAVSLVNYDFDQPIYDLLTKVFQTGAQAVGIPDIRDIRVPLFRGCTTEAACA